MRFMRIVVDLQAVQTASRSRGIGRYALALTKEIARQAGSHDIWLLLSGNFPDALERVKSQFTDLVPESRILIFKTPSPVAYSLHHNIWRARTAEVLREFFLANLQPDIVYITSLFEGWLDDATTSLGIIRKAHKSAVTLYDLVPFLNPAAYLSDQGARDYYFQKVASLKKADLLMSISEYARQEGIAALQLPPERIVNISTAADDIFRPLKMSAEETRALHKRYGIVSPFVMYAGGFDPRKNLSRLFKAFSLLPKPLRHELQLLLAGEASEAVQGTLRTEAKRFGMSDRLVLTDYVPDDDLVGLYNTCELFVFPSLHEGFGLPALEAMACGAPTIGSNTTSIPEVIEYPDALFDPRDPRDMAEKMNVALANDVWRGALRDHGLRQAKKFSWQASARRAWQAFENMSPAAGLDQPALVPTAHGLYRELIDAIAGIEVDPVQPTNRDLQITAQSIWDNAKTIEQALRAAECPEDLR